VSEKHPTRGRKQPPRDGDKRQARMTVNYHVRRGMIRPPNDLPCVDCGHVWEEGERRHEYDHHLGYDAANHLSIEAVCSECHAMRRWGVVGTCKNGHPWPESMGRRKKDGRRFCRACDNAKKKRTRGPEYWKRRRDRRRASEVGDGS
jgi:hypothetical protein